MLLAASIATMDWQVIGGTFAVFIGAASALKFFIWDGCGKDDGTLIPMPHDAFDVREVAGKGRGLFAAKHVAKGSFLMRYEGDRIDDLEFERRYAADPFSDEAGYVLRINDDEFIDGSDPERSGLARYMNHANAPNVIKFIAQVDLACWRAEEPMPASAMTCVLYCRGPEEIVAFLRVATSEPARNFSLVRRHISGRVRIHPHLSSFFSQASEGWASQCTRPPASKCTRCSGLARRVKLTHLEMSV